MLISFYTDYITCVPIHALIQLLPIIPEIGNIKKNPKEVLNFLDQIDQFSIDAIAVANPGQVCTQCNKDIINTFGNFLKNNILALQVLAQVGINQTRIDTMTIGVAVKYGITFEDGEIPDNSSK
ncbi:hypothetical protein F8M41_009290 [Gigaspora margarita]|uniref:Uncharacterized protein n=1 Tax=Gigaspora margarita TaxID=4874 RepID=A0A8H4EVA6_GIGMA|nr:hypothetical protein F8M41_009290 [Gigaspora margarita]